MISEDTRRNKGTQGSQLGDVPTISRVFVEVLISKSKYLAW